MLQMPHLPWTFQKESLTGDISTEGYNNVRLTSVNIVKQKVSYSIVFLRGKRKLPLSPDIIFFD